MTFACVSNVGESGGDGWLSGGEEGDCVVRSAGASETSIHREEVGSRIVGRFVGEE